MAEKSPAAALSRLLEMWRAVGPDEDVPDAVNVDDAWEAAEAAVASGDTAACRAALSRLVEMWRLVGPDEDVPDAINIPEAWEAAAEAARPTVPQKMKDMLAGLRDRRPPRAR